jgi:hypothetical protein
MPSMIRRTGCCSAEEVVVKEQITNDMIAAGLELTRRLRDRSDFELDCSLWLYTSESNNWRLVVATPLAEDPGPLYVYRLLQGIIRGEQPTNLELDLATISVLRSNHPFILAVHSLHPFEIHAGAMPKKITSTRIQDVFIEDARIYFIK